MVSISFHQHTGLNTLFTLDTMIPDPIQMNNNLFHKIITHPKILVPTIVTLIFSLAQVIMTARSQQHPHISLLSTMALTLPPLTIQLHLFPITHQLCRSVAMAMAM